MEVESEDNCMKGEDEVELESADGCKVKTSAAEAVDWNVRVIKTVEVNVVSTNSCSLKVDDDESKKMDGTDSDELQMASLCWTLVQRHSSKH